MARARSSLPIVIVLGAVWAVLGARLARVAQRVAFPTDHSLWGDGYFMTTMVKLAQGLAIYGDVDAVHSTIYSPGPALVHHALLWPFGWSESVVANRTLNLVWLAWAIVAALGVVKTLLQQLHGRGIDGTRLSGAADTGPPEWLELFLAAGVLLLAAVANVVIESLHPGAAELAVVCSAMLVAVRWPRLSRRARWVSLCVLPATALLVKQTGGVAVTVALFWVALRESRSRGDAITCGALVAASFALCLGALVVATGGAFWTWGYRIPAAQPLEWGKWDWWLRDTGGLPFLLPLVALPVVALVARRAEPGTFAHAWKRGATVAVAYALLALVAFAKKYGGANNIAQVGFLATVVVAPLLVRALTRGGAATVVGLSALLGQVALWHPARWVPMPEERSTATAVCDYVRERLRCGERVLMARGSVCYAGTGVEPLDRMNSLNELRAAGYEQIGTFRRIEQQEYDIVAFSRIDLNELGQPLWLKMRGRYAPFHITPGSPTAEFWRRGWQNFASRRIVFFERVRDRDEPSTPKHRFGQRCERR